MTPILLLLAALSGVTAYDLPAPYATWPVNARSIAKPIGHPAPMGSKVCVHFPKGDRITYTVRDVCPAGNWDIHVRAVNKRVRRDVEGAKVTIGWCK